MRISQVGTSGIVSQDDLAKIRMLDNQVRRLVRVRNRIAQAVLDRINSGSTVEPGTLDAEIQETRKGACRLQKLIVR